MSFPTELLKGTLKPLILALLSEGDKYGYQLIKQLKEKSDALFDTGEGSIYPALHALEKKGLLKSYWKPQAEGPDRKYYQLTHKGAKELKTAKKEWQTFTQAVHKIYGFDVA